MTDELNIESVKGPAEMTLGMTAPPPPADLRERLRKALMPWLPDDERYHDPAIEVAIAVIGEQWRPEAMRVCKRLAETKGDDYDKEVREAIRLLQRIAGLTP